MESRYSIKDLEHLTGVKAHTIRIWEQRYNIVEPARTDTNIRFYRDPELKKLLNVSVLVHGGMKISKVAALTEQERAALVQDHTKYSGNFEGQVNGLKIAMLDFDDELFDRILTNAMATVGSEVTFTQIVGAFIHEVGILWQTNAISIVHEHFASNLIKQKLFVAIDSAFASKPTNGTPRKTYLLYLPADELHELALLYVAFALKAAGNRVIYLGQCVPLEYLPELLQRGEVDAMVSFFTTYPSDSDLPDYLKRLNEMLEAYKIEWYGAGSQLTDIHLDEKSSRLHVSKNLNDLKSALLKH